MEQDAGSLAYLDAFLRTGENYFKIENGTSCAPDSCVMMYVFRQREEINHMSLIVTPGFRKILRLARQLPPRTAMIFR